MRVLVVLLALLVACSPARPAARAASVDLSAVMERQIADGFSGVVIVADKDRVPLRAAYGAVHDVPMRVNTRFWISSMGKQFVAAAIVLLRDEGKLALDEPITRFLPDAPPDKRAITPRQLLSHTSGLPQGYVGEKASSSDEAARNILAVPLVDPPGTRFVYANDNYQLAAVIVERVSGRPYREFVAEHFFRRLGLADTGVASGAGAHAAPTREPTPDRLLRPNWGIEGHYASAPDLLRWARALASGEVLKPSSVRELMTPSAKTKEAEVALGWFVNRTARGTDRIWTRGNDDFGANSLLYMYPHRGVVIIVLTHAGDRREDLSQSRATLAALENALGL